MSRQFRNKMGMAQSCGLQSFGPLDRILVFPGVSRERVVDSLLRDCTRHFRLRI